jgi:hypothetical protein
MGYRRHHAIIVTSCLSEEAYPGTSIETAHRIACGIFGDDLISPIVSSRINGYKSFFVAPDGSKEGWNESNVGDQNREEFVAWLGSACYDDGSSSLDWAEIQYGDEEGDNRVLRHSR